MMINNRYIRLPGGLRDLGGKCKTKPIAGLRPEIRISKHVLSEVEWIRNPKQ